MTESVPLPPPPAPTPAQAPCRGRRVDVFLAALVVGFAFLAASFPVRNSDFWLHLAAGRLLAHGEYAFGANHFSYTAGDAYWANHSWLFDLLLYLSHEAVGDTALVVLKAVAVAVLAGVLLLLARPPGTGVGPFWVSAGCVLLALLAMSPRLLLQPACVSFLLLAVCLVCLRAGARAFYAVPVVIALWVNLDSWFLLGPLLVALFWLGQRGTAFPLWLLPTSLLACLVSPHHYHALTLPPELSPGLWRSDLPVDVRFAPFFASPWRLQPLGLAGGYNLAAWASLLLLAIGLVSFAVNRAAWRDWRLPVWLAFALLAAWQARLIPFFAVVAGPITALNMRERLPALALPRVGRAVILLCGFALCALTWPGWLQGFHRHDRPLAWTVIPDPSLVRLAQTLDRWRADGGLPSGSRTFAIHPDVGNYCAWFYPDEKCFLDSRLTPFLGVAREYESVCLALDPTLRPPLPAGAPDWERVLREHDVSCLVLYDPDLRRLGTALRTVTLAPERWELLRVDGQAVLVAWKEPSRRPGVPAFDAERAAFGPDPSAALPPAPGEGVTQLLPPSWWQTYSDRPTGSSWEADAAAVYLRLFDDRGGPELQAQRSLVLGRHAAGLVGTGAGDGLPGLLGVTTRLALPQVFLADVQERSAALPLLSVRAARRAVAEHPDDATAWLVLGQAYLSLARATPEATSTRTLPPLAELRRIQIATALARAVALNPDLATAHETLALLFAEQRYYDLALKHRTAQLALVRRTGRLPGEEETDFAARLERLQNAVEQMEGLVQTNENRYFVRAQPLSADPLARARLALELGLGGKALDEVLLRSHPDLYRVEGLRLLLELLLQTGRAQDARDLLERDEMRNNPDGLGFHDLPATRLDGRRYSYRFPAYSWFDLCQAAAVGDYDRAGIVLKHLRDRLEHEGAAIITRLTPGLALHVASELGLAAAPEAVPLQLYRRMERDQVAGWVVMGEFLAVERADLHVVEAMLLVERGLPEQAGQHFRLALSLFDQAPDTAPARPGEPLAQHYQHRILRATSAPRGLP